MIFQEKNFKQKPVECLGQDISPQKLLSFNVIRIICILIEVTADINLYNNQAICMISKRHTNYVYNIIYSKHLLAYSCIKVTILLDTYIRIFDNNTVLYNVFNVTVPRWNLYRTSLTVYRWSMIDVDKHDFICIKLPYNISTSSSSSFTEIANIIY